jgi:predicted transposase YbfD/YdcC
MSCKKRRGAENFAVIRHIALNLLKQELSAKVGIRNKRLKAASNDEYLLKVLMSE